MIYYAIHTPTTGAFLPQDPRAWRAYSHVEPKLPSQAVPRFFFKPQAARYSLNNWLAGKKKRDYSGDYEGRLHVVPMPDRIAAEWIIIAAEIHASSDPGH